MFPLMERAERGLRRESNPLSLLREEVDSLFDRFFKGWMVPEDVFREMPAWEWEETEKEFVGRVPVPGFEPAEIDVRLHDNVMTIKAEHREEKGKAKEGPVESHYGRLERTVTLPEGTNPEKLEAHYRNGMLEIHVPRVPEAAPRKIEVKS